MMDNRLKKNNNAGRESRALDDQKRAAPEENFVSSEERRRMFRSEWLQEALPTPLNARWFLRNEAIKHRNHPLYVEAMRIAQELVASEK